jgi:hypothetical protein
MDTRKKEIAGIGIEVLAVAVYLLVTFIIAVIVMR